jgi:hypothetical protein
MALKKASNRVEVFDLEGTKIHAVKPDKSAWDEYTDSLFDRTGGELKVKTGEGMKTLYRACIKKIEDAEIDGALVVLADSDKIVDFLSHLEDIESARKLDSWLMGLGELTPAESKNSGGEPAVSLS